MKILVLGDRIIDQYTYGKGMRLCPEACAPVIHIKKEATTEGGAALVYEQIKALIGADKVEGQFGSVSYKHRVFADRTLICRIDRDTYSVMPSESYWKIINKSFMGVSAVVVGDYGKGAMSVPISTQLSALCRDTAIPLFVDAKSDPRPYKGCFAIFPNEEEHSTIEATDYQHVIRKMGANGCLVDGVHIPTKEQQVYDVTGAGDIFLAAFVVAYLNSDLLTKARLEYAAGFANKVARESVKHLGTYVVQHEDLYA